jgi:hypothetical protein
MQMKPALQIQSVLKALTDVVLPAVDPHNKLAQEQLRLVIGTLSLMQQQLPLQFRFDCDELRRLLALCRQLQPLVPDRPGPRTAAAVLESQTRLAAGVLERAQAGPAEVEQAVRALRACSGELITQVFEAGEPGSRQAVQDAVLRASREQLLRDRAWVLPQNWEPDPKVLPPLEVLI